MKYLIEATTLAAIGLLTLYAGLESIGIPRAPLEGEYVQSLVFEPGSPSIVYAGTQKWRTTQRGGLFKSFDGGRSWEPSDVGLPSSVIETIVLDPHNSEVLYAGTFRDGLFRSLDGAGSWSHISTGLTPPERRPRADIKEITVNSIGINPNESTKMFVATWAGVFKSEDRGETWIRSSEGLADDIVSRLVIDPTTPTTLYVCVMRHGIFRSLDAGATWQLASTGYDPGTCSGLTLASSPSTILYAGSYDKLFRSTDGADTWELVSPKGIGEISTLVLDPLDSKTIFLTAKSGLYRSSDGASTWALLTSRPGFRTLAIQPTNSDHLLSSTDDNELLRSLDGGQSWRPANLSWR